jgi:hypothetical protein
VQRESIEHGIPLSELLCGCGGTTENEEPAAKTGTGWSIQRLKVKSKTKPSEQLVVLKVR